VGEVSSIVKEIAETAHDQASSIDGVANTLSQVNGMTQQNAALVEEVAASADGLSGQAREMRTQVGSFHLAGRGAMRGPEGGVPVALSTDTAAADPSLEGASPPATAATTTGKDDEWVDF